MRLTKKSAKQYLVSKLFVLTLFICVINSCKQKNPTIISKDDSYKLDSAINTLNNIKWTKKTNSNSFSSLIDTTIELPEEIISKERLKLNSDIYEDSSAWYMEGPATYNLIMQRVHFDKTPISLDGDDENTTIVNSDFSLPFSTDIPATRKFENDSIIEVSDLHFYKKADFTQNALKNRIRFFECDFKGSFAIQPLYVNPIFEDCIFYNGFKITQWWNNNDEAINPEFKEQKKNHLHKDLIFNSCVLNGKFDFSNVSFDSTSTLVVENAYLPDTLDLTNLQVIKPINLLKSYPNINGKKCEIIITDFDVDKLLMQYRFFHLFIPPQILNNEKYHDYIASFYQRLLNRFKENGFIESYESLDIEFNRWKSKYDWTLVLSDYWWEFGYKKWRILLYTIGFIFIFSLFNYRKFSKLQEVYPVKKLKWNNFYYTRYTLLSFARKFFATLLYTGLIFFRFSIDYKNVTFKPMRYVAIIIFQYTIGLICTGFLINWILKG